MQGPVFTGNASGYQITWSDEFSLYLELSYSEPNTSGSKHQRHVRITTHPTFVLMGRQPLILCSMSLLLSFEGIGRDFLWFEHIILVGPHFLLLLPPWIHFHLDHTLPPDSLAKTTISVYWNIDIHQVWRRATVKANTTYSETNCRLKRHFPKDFQGTQNSLLWHQL